MKKEVLIEVSARHIHLTQEQVEILFGKGHKLTPKKYLSQPGHFLAEERVDIVGPKKIYKSVAILGPVRDKAQVELALSDCFSLGVEGMLRDSGDIKDTPGIILKSELAEAELKEGVIVPRRHIHMTYKDASEYGLKDMDVVCVRVEAGLGRDITFADVLVRVSDEYALSMHIDTDEGNAAMLLKHGKGIIMT